MTDEQLGYLIEEAYNEGYADGRDSAIHDKEMVDRYKLQQKYVNRVITFQRGTN